MSNTIPPRIEREAEEYANKHGFRSNGVYDTTNELEAAYEASATVEFNRAAPVAKALQEAVEHYIIIRDSMYVLGAQTGRLSILIDKLNQILETYKSDNV